jgi:RES domain-containing protein
VAAPVVLWRIGTDTPEYLADDLTGTGASITGGRWNRKRTPLVYASTSRALACLETIVHLGGADPLPLNRYLVEITLPDSAWKRRVVFSPRAHVGWDARPAGKISIDWGSRWCRGTSSLLAEVPSVIVPEESNVLINPLHADIGIVRARKVRRWDYDARLGALAR